MTTRMEFIRRLSGARKPVIHLYTIGWNEAYMLPYFFRHYDEFVDRYVFYDDNSTDGSLAILAGHPKVEVRPLARSDKDSFVLLSRDIHNECWKESRGMADWVLITDIDEHLYHKDMLQYISQCQQKGVTLIPGVGYQMLSVDLPCSGRKLTDIVTRGAPHAMMNKLGFFDPNQVTETNFEVGRHTAVPVGNVVYPPHDEVLLLHYKYLSPEWTFHRHSDLHEKRGKIDRQMKFGFHYAWTKKELAHDWEKFEKNAVGNVLMLSDQSAVTRSESETPWRRKNLHSVEGKKIKTATLENPKHKMRKKWFGFYKAWLWLKFYFSPVNAALDIIMASESFDADWYLATYPDIAVAKIDPARHYLEFGASEGRDPGPFFSTSEYRINHLQIARNGMNPLLHFERFSWRRKKKYSASAEAALTDADRKAIQSHIGRLQNKPLITVVVPAYNTPERFLREAIESVIAQSYSKWELCIANDASSNPEVARILNEFAAKDRRIKIIHRKKNGNISAATNSALELAKGKFVALMDHDDLLHETALYEVAVEINAHPDVDIIYSDEDRIDENGKRSNAYYKTDFNPELLLGQNMVSHLGVYRRSLINKIGGFRLGFEGSQDYDLTLRAWNASSNDRIRHIPAVLYHWRQGASAQSFSETQLEKCVNAARRAIQEFLDIEGEGAKVVASPDIGNFSRVIRQVPEPQPLVSVIVPTKDHAGLLSICVDGILNKTDYQNVEVLIVDHESKEHKTQVLLEKLKRDPRVRILSHKGEFNYSAINNMAAMEARGTILALVNNDIEVVESGWLKEMVSHVLRAEVGAVGAKLLYPNGTIQHAGVVIGLGGIAGHAFYSNSRNSVGYFGQASLARSVSAVTAACLLVRKSVFLEVNGLDAENLTVAFNDVDFCLRIQAKGYRNVWSPFAKLIHHESVSRGKDKSPVQKARSDSECAYMRAHWQHVIENDPFYNQNLTLDLQNYEVAKPSRRRKPWLT